MKKKTVALFGGSFNPPHANHSRVVRLLERLPYIDEIWLMPSANRWDKKISVSGPDRLRMLDLMIGDMHAGSSKHIRAFDHEIRKPNLSTTFETMNELAHLYPYHEFHLVFGTDVASDIRKTWVHGTELADAGRFIFVGRAGFSTPDTATLPAHHTMLSMPEGDSVSSTLVRAMIHDGADTSGHLSPSVTDFIRDKKLYR